MNTSESSMGDTREVQGLRRDNALFARTVVFIDVQDEREHKTKGRPGPSRPARRSAAQGRCAAKPLHKRWQTFHQCERNEHAEQRAEYAQCVPREGRSARHRAEEQNAG
jgi:hypothetical protein